MHQQTESIARKCKDAAERLLSAHSEPGHTFDEHWFDRTLQAEANKVVKSRQRLDFARQHAATIGKRACPKS